MQYTQLGHTDLHVSRLAFGTWSFGGDWGPAQVEESRRAIRKALDLWINFFDTAQAYGFGAAETVLAEALLDEIKHHRNSVVVATKGGPANRTMGVVKLGFEKAEPGSCRRG